jgi:acyl carrier protein phosphodiesterase
MNHLAHFLLAGSETGLIVGGFLGDFVKGRLPVEDNQGRSGDSLNAALAGLEHGIVRGIRLHRAIDGYTDSHTIVKQSQRRFSTPLRRFAPVITDVVYDHFLACHWSRFHTTSLSQFAAEVCRLVLSRQALLPPLAKQLISSMQHHRSMENYTSHGFVDRTLQHLSLRLRRENPLLAGCSEFLHQREALEADFLTFFPDLLDFASDWQAEHPLRLEAPANKRLNAGLANG